jgi:hypothetical protein
MDASTEYIYVDLDAQEAPKKPPRVLPLEGVNTLDPLQFANLLAANDRLVAPPGEHAEDAVEIELSAEQMDALLEGRWVP